MNTNYLLNIVGPTAIGKTSLAIELANRFATEIISADSRQFYKEMTIGTAVPSKEELEAAKHHFIQHISIQDTYNVGDFETEALEKLDELFKERNIVIMVGGSGLYTKSVLEGLDYFPEVSSEIRKDLNLKFEKEGLTPLQNKLQELDPDYFKIVDIENPHRLIRALEVCISSQKPYSSYLNQPKKTRNFTAISIGLDADRNIIYDRINKRVDIMIKEGLIEEAKNLFPKRELNALNTVGYKELFAYLEGNQSLETAISEIKKNTRRFAKRQLTWFKKDKETNWFNYKTPVETIQNFIESKINT
ncbi:tRNA (adenosine(37)-N6)-dimethylallyltransferase MiaA [Salegentibacter sp. BLCTC]|uniref:tRNA (adenosine(37)-N6)-dimethylallyltransferase MiaA n=1 Tax=Salegentibacter sp. BLCTC TaxID=2697368 RepID=UPI00187B9F8D|nr:tRNA (adenosine(37)-N6)-dimethylallyltransferase MiaA [Salegentibacter sp. BLCTC]MBE7640097.1 tRNA (adenosine(37)-N6)-dimethylallyltransferase MiaA [Salegentibacter sp. BLCTC]